MPDKKTVIGRDGLPRTIVKSERSKRAQPEDIDRAIELQGGSAAFAESKSKITAKQMLYVLLGGAGLAFLVLTGWGITMLVGSDPDRSVKLAPLEEDDGLGKRMLSADEVARSFASETDEEKRLSYVRTPDVIKQHLPNYPEQARSHPAKEIKLMGHRELNGSAVTAYAAAFEDGSFRMLAVVQTDDGPKVDWDGYARYCSASWEDLVSGKAVDAEVRVFVRPGDYHVGQFRDRQKWTCFKLETPDSDRSIYAYAPAGSDLSKRIQTYVMKSRGFRQHMTLKIKSVNCSGKDALFVVDELLAMGWVRE